MLKLTNLVGFGARAVVVPTTFDLIGSNTSTAETVTAPASINSGDLLYLFDLGINSLALAPTAVTPSGFTNFLNDSDFSGTSGNGARLLGSRKIADGTEDSSTLTGMNGTLSNDKVVLQFRVSTFAISSVTQYGGSASGDGDLASDVLEGSGKTPPLVGCGVYGCEDGVSGRSFTAAEDGEVTSSSRLYVKYKTYVESPANHTIDIGDGGNNNFLAWVVHEVAS